MYLLTPLWKGSGMGVRRGNRVSRRQRVAGCDVVSACVPLHINRAVEQRLATPQLKSCKRPQTRWVRGGSMASGERGGWPGKRGWILIFCSGVQPVPCRTPHAVHATQPVVACAVRHAPPFASGELARRAELFLLCSTSRLPVGSRARAPVRGCRPACVHKAQQCRYFRAIHSTSGTTW